MENLSRETLQLLVILNIPAEQSNKRCVRVCSVNPLLPTLFVSPVPAKLSHVLPVLGGYLFTCRHYANQFLLVMVLILSLFLPSPLAELHLRCAGLRNSIFQSFGSSGESIEIGTMWSTLALAGLGQGRDISIAVESNGS